MPSKHTSIKERILTKIENRKKLKSYNQDSFSQGYVLGLYEAIEAISEAREERDREITEWAVKVTISKFLQMNVENPRAPVNIDEVRRLALSDLITTLKKK